MIIRITRCVVVEPFRLNLTFNDGTRKTVDVRPLLEGPIFEPLRNGVYFSKAALNDECGTVAWPNGADFAPEALYALEAVEQHSVS